MPGSDLRMFMAKDGLWFATPDDGVKQTQESVQGLLLREQPSAVRLYGSASQAESVMSVIHTIQRPVSNWRCSLYVGSPGDLKSRASPAQSLQQMTSLYTLSPYFGGWRQLRGGDFPLFAFLAESHRGKWEGANVWRANHPGARATNFLNAWDQMAQCRLLAAIEDPRWFHRDINHPERESHLRTFLGMTPKNISSAANGKPARAYNWRRFELLLTLLFNCVGPLAPQPKWFANQPGPLLFRKFRETMSATAALTKTLDLAVSFLRQAWLQELAPAGREVFVPKYFFGALGSTGKTLARQYQRTKPRPQGVVPEDADEHKI